MTRTENCQTVKQQHLNESCYCANNHERARDLGEAEHRLHKVGITRTSKHRAHQQNHSAQPQSNAESVSNSDYIIQERNILANTSEAIRCHHQRDDGDRRHLCCWVNNLFWVECHPECSGDEYKSQDQNCSATSTRVAKPTKWAECASESVIGMTERIHSHD